MSTLATLAVRLVGDNSEFYNSLTDAEGRSQSFAGRMSSTLTGAATTVAVGAGTALLGGITAVGVGAVSLARSAAPLETIQESFGNLAESAGSGMDDMLSALQRGSAGMVTNRDLMESFNSAAQLVGTDFAVRLPDAMGSLGRVAAATGGDVGFLLDSLVTGVGRLSPMILDNLGIQVDLVEANQEYADSIGKNVDELTKQEQQTALMNQVMSKLEENTASLPDVAGSSEQAFASWGVMLANVKDEIGLKLLPVIAPLMERLISLGSQYIPLVVAALGPFLEKLGTVVDLLLAGDLAGALSTLFSPEVSDQIMNIVTSISEFIGQIVSFVEEHSETFKGAIIGIGVALGAAAIVGTILGIVGAVAALANPITLIIGVAALLGAAWSSNWGGIQEKTQTVITFVREIISAGLAWLQSFWSENGETIKTVWSTIWDAVSGYLETVFGVVSSIFDAFRSAFQGDWEGFGTHLREAWDQWWDYISGVFETVKETLIGAVGTLVDTISTIITETDWLSVGQSILEGIAAGLEAGLEFITNAARNVASAALDAAKGFLGIDSPSRVMIEQVGRPMAQGVAVGWKSGLDRERRNMGSNLLSLSSGFPTSSPGSGIGGPSLVFQIDARGSELGVEDRIRKVVEEVLRDQNRRGTFAYRTR